MLDRLLYFIRGYVRIRIYGNSPERFLNLCRHHGVHVWGLIPKDHTYEMFLTVQGFKKIHAISRKTRTRVRITGKYGLPFILFRYRRRKLFFVSAVLMAILVLQYSGFIWDIQFEGNEKWTDPVLMEFLAELDVVPGMKKEKIDCSEIAAEIRQEYNDIVWVSVSIDGSCLKIKVKENEDTFLNIENAEETMGQLNIEETVIAKDIVAAKDGTITSMITRNGVPLVQIGDEVKKGDILVSGRIEIMDDSAQVIEYQYCQADADVFADTEIVYEDTMKRFYKEKNYIDKEERRKWYVIIGNRMLSVGTDKNDTANKKEIFREEYQLKLGENFYLPVMYGSIILKSYKEIEKNYSNEEIQKLLSRKFTIFLEEMEKKGIQIRENSVKISCYDNYASAGGMIYLNESITKTADTEILEIERNELK